MMLTVHPLDLDDALNMVEATGRYGPRDRVMFYLRTILRLKDIAHLRTIEQVLDVNRDVRKIIDGADSRKIDLPPRARSEIERYLFNRFRTELRLVDRELGLFPTEKSPYGATMKTLPQLFWAIDERIRKKTRQGSTYKQVKLADHPLPTEKSIDSPHHELRLEPYVGRSGKLACRQTEATMISSSSNGYINSLRRVLATVLLSSNNYIIRKHA
jgi:hypothetical protein